MTKTIVTLPYKKLIMDRKDFLKKGLFGTGMFVATAALGNIIKNDIDELKELVENIGFEPITSSLPAKRSSQMS